MSTPTRAAAVEAAATYLSTQPDIDALKDTIAANEASKKILGEYMLTQTPALKVFRGVTLSVSPFSGWDSDALRAHLGAAAAKFRKELVRKHFGVRTPPVGG